MLLLKRLSLLFLLLGLFTCSYYRPVSQEVTQVEFIVLQLNDVYEIGPLEGGKAGGLARVATVRKELLRENPNVITIMAGDFLSPSFVGTLKFTNEEGKQEKIAGLQMIETLNAMGLDYATFGNHEFDLSDADLLEKRIAQSKFKYTVCNARKIEGDSMRPFNQGADPVPEYVVRSMQNKTGDSFRLGLFGVVLPFAQQDYLHYDNVTESFRKTYEVVKQNSELQIAITHQNLDEDLQLAADVPGVPLFIGGHEHANLSRYVGKTVITKADANAKTVYIHRIKYDNRSKMYEDQLRITHNRRSYSRRPDHQKSGGQVAGQSLYRHDRTRLFSRQIADDADRAAGVQRVLDPHLTNKLWSTDNERHCRRPARCRRVLHQLRLHAPGR